MADVNKGWIFFELIDQQFGLPIKNLLQMVVLEKVSKLQNAPNYVRGIITLRGAVIPVIDLRERLGLLSMHDETAELVALLNQKKSDHINWLNALRKSVEDSKEFALATDPHKCAFGRWYDTFVTDNAVLRTHLENFDRPHKKIHSIAIEVKQLVHDGEQGKAFDLIEQTKNEELAKMIELFDKTESIFTESLHEIVLVNSIGDQKVGYIVDFVNEVRDLETADIQDAFCDDIVNNNSFLYGVSNEKNEIRLLLDINKIISENDVASYNIT
ncbi:MAG: hypothetical protein GY847_36920 [Proteobacteria bacterium]|nr:hypothetical protein [Pseudomonadota bacterium]